MGTISSFMAEQFKHFNARETLDAAKAWKKLIEDGGEMFFAMAGAMSSAELGISLSKAIRAKKIHAICCTAANFEEDLFNLFANQEYAMAPHYRELRAEDELELRNGGFNRVTDTCIPESVMRHTDTILTELWKDADARAESKFPWEFVYDLLDHADLEQHFQIPAEHSWVIAAKQEGLPIYTPGWEDSTLGNLFTSRVIDGTLGGHACVRTGTEQMQHLVAWYMDRCERSTPVGFFQIGGGIAGDFSICVVPLILQDLKRKVPFWAYFAQISDSITSYGSYSGAVPNEKITWYKLGVDTPKFMINSDATIVAPLIFAYVLGE